MSSELTGIKEVDEQIEELRARRNSAAEEQIRAQNQIDELFVKSMVPDIDKGHYIRYTKDDMTIEGKVAYIRRVFGGVTIAFDTVAYIPRSDEYDSVNDEMTLVHCSSHNETISVKKEDLSSITKITREEFIGSIRTVFEDLVSKTRESENSKQLKLNI